MGRFVVAHGVDDGNPPEDHPYVPDIFILCEGNRFWTISKSTGEEIDIGETGYQHKIESGAVFSLPSPSSWEEGRWAAVDISGLSFFDRGTEDKWKADRLMPLIREATGLVGDPEKSLSLLRAAGNLIGVSVPQLVGHLEKMRKNPKESLFDIYKRVK